MMSLLGTFRRFVKAKKCSTNSESSTLPSFFLSNLSISRNSSSTSCPLRSFARRAMNSISLESKKPLLSSSRTRKKFRICRAISRRAVELISEALSASSLTISSPLRGSTSQSSSILASNSFLLILLSPLLSNCWTPSNIKEAASSSKASPANSARAACAMTNSCGSTKPFPSSSQAANKDATAFLSLFLSYFALLASIFSPNVLVFFLARFPISAARPSGAQQLSGPVRPS
mmetsp:Transcript_35639/g.80514  ORF Transcript_35639/g.80514 Transcript_35639/m.80514 type:complete len:232 (+) Transcript_35639:219-914(+)